MWQVIYDMLLNSNVLGGAIDYPATEVLARYLAYAGTIGILAGIIVFAFSIFGILRRIFKG